MDLLIVYASRYGQTQKVASRIADVAEQEGARARVYDVDSVPAGIAFPEFDAVILAGGIAWGKHPRSLRRFIVQNRPALAKSRTIFVSVSGAAEFESSLELARSYVERLFRQTEWRAGSSVTFGGGVAFSRYGPFNRWLLRRQQRKNKRPTDPAHDYDYTDWEAVDAFARGLVVRPALHGAA